MTDKVHLVFPEQDLSIKGMFAYVFSPINAKKMITPNKTGQSYTYTNFYPQIGAICRNWSYM